MIPSNTMLCKIFNILCPPYLSKKWLDNNTIQYSCLDFKDDKKQSGGKPIFHVTDYESAQSIYESGKIFGIDTVSSAHFHHTPQGASRQAASVGVALGFSWHGTVIKIDLSDDPSSHRDRRANILFDVPCSETNDETWELRLYPGTTSLQLRFVEIANTGYLLKSPKNIEVILNE